MSELKLQQNFFAAYKKFDFNSIKPNLSFKQSAIMAYSALIIDYILSSPNCLVSSIKIDKIYHLYFKEKNAGSSSSTMIKQLQHHFTHTSASDILYTLAMMFEKMLINKLNTTPYPAYNTHEIAYTLNVMIQEMINLPIYHLKISPPQTLPSTYPIHTHHHHQYVIETIKSDTSEFSVMIHQISWFQEALESPIINNMIKNTTPIKNTWIKPELFIAYEKALAQIDLNWTFENIEELYYVILDHQIQNNIPLFHSEILSDKKASEINDILSQQERLYFKLKQACARAIALQNIDIDAIRNKTTRNDHLANNKQDISYSNIR